MLTLLLRKTRNSLRRIGPLHRALVQLGVSGFFKRRYEKRVIAAGTIEVVLLGQRLQFIVTTPREIHRVESFHAESAFVGEMMKVLQPGDVVWDVGANIGVISLVLAKSSDVIVHAFEPEPRNFAHLQQNIELNGLQRRVIPHQLAMGNLEGEVQLHIGGEVGEGRHSTVSPGDFTNTILSVRVTTAARFAEEIGGCPAVLKIDVEGAEIEVAEGLSPLLKERQIRAVYVEVHPTQLAEQGHSAEAFAKLMATHGYTQVSKVRRESELHQAFAIAGDCESVAE